MFSYEIGNALYVFIAVDAGACSQEAPTCSGSTADATEPPPLLNSQESVVSSENIFADDGRNASY